MKRNQLIDALAARFEGNKKLAADALDAVLDTITREVARGEKVAIKGFGTFEKVLPKKAAKDAEKTKKAAKKKPFVPQFRAAKELTGVVSGAIKLPKLPTAPGVKKAVDEAAARTEAVVDQLHGQVQGQTEEVGDAPRDEVAVAGGTAKAAPAKKGPTAKKPAAKKTPTAKKSSAAKKSAEQKTPAATTPAAKTPAAKTPTQKAAAAKSSATKSSTTKAAASKTSASKTSAGDPSAAKKTAAKKAPAKKTPAAKKSTPPTES